MSELIDRLRDGPEMKESESGWFSYPDIISTEKLLDEAADALEAKDALISQLTSDLSDIKELIDRHHDNGELVEGGDLRYWSHLLAFSLARAKEQE